jgi:anti-sigma regulatory factor (Ser/Thr protein kinase)
MIAFPNELTSVAAARTFVARAIGHCREETIEVARLLTSELATNALVHAHSTFAVEATESEGIVHVEVTDGSSVRPEPILTEILSTHGRGLYLVNEFSSRWGVIDAPPGKTVWFDLRCRGGPDGEGSGSTDVKHPGRCDGH